MPAAKNTAGEFRSIVRIESRWTMPTDPEHTKSFFFRQMFLIRTIEQEFLSLFAKGHISGTIHTCIGQEACAVGVLNAVRQDLDLVFSNHRSHGHAIAFGIPVERLIAEVLGKVSGLCCGIGGSQHLCSENFFTTGIQGGLVPVAVGAAMAEKFAKSGAIAVVFLGDGTMGQGIVSEGFNLAAIWNLPIIFVLEDNKYAQSTSRHATHAGDLYRRSEAFGIPSVVVDGNDVERIYATAKEIVEATRAAQKPYFFVLDTYRLGPHSKGDDTRSPEELNPHWKNDPLLLLKTGLDVTEAKRIEDAVLAEVRERFARIMAEPSLAPEEFLRRCGER
jgi:acetoin:2,6-dichlorophenolindophenol oxidoreductase subunit alpha